MTGSRQKQVYQLVTTVQWVVIALTLLYTQLPHLEHIEKYVYWMLILSVAYALIYSKLPETIYSKPKFFLWTSLIYQLYVALLVFFTGKIQSDLHWLFLLPILFIASYYGMQEGLLSATVSSVLLIAIYFLDPRKISAVIFWHICFRRLSVLLGTALFVGLFANEEIRERRQIEASHELSQMYMQDPSLQNVLTSAYKKISELFNVEIYALMLYDPREKKLAAQKPVKGLIQNQIDGLSIFMGPQNTIISMLRERSMISMLREGEVFVSNEAQNDPRLPENIIKMLEIRNLLITGLISKKEMIGILVIANKKGSRSFGPNDALLLKTIVNQTAIYLERVILYERTKRNAEEATIFFDIGKALCSTINLEILLNLITESTANYFGADVCCLMLLGEEAKELSSEAAYCSDSDDKGLGGSSCPLVKLKIGEGVSGWVAKNAQPLLIPDFHVDSRFKSTSILCGKEVGSAISVPLIAKDKVIGVLNVGNILPHKFGEEDLKTLTTLASEAAVAIHNAQLFNQLEELYLDTLKALVAAIEAKDRYTRGHSEHVIKYALAIAEGLNLSEAEKNVVKTAALLHDIGKIGVSEKILLKPGKLAHEEQDQVRRHPSMGFEILSSIKALREITPLILYHHERYDGKGYPAQLRGERIPLVSRILAVADAFEAMTSDRPYRKALSFEKALAELKKEAGSQFDPQVVKVFVDFLNKPNIEEELMKIEKQFEDEKVLFKKG